MLENNNGETNSDSLIWCNHKLFDPYDVVTDGRKSYIEEMFIKDRNYPYKNVLNIVSVFL